MQEDDSKNGVQGEEEEELVDEPDEKKIKRLK